MSGIDSGADTVKTRVNDILDAAKVPQGNRGRWHRLLGEHQDMTLAGLFYLVADCGLPLNQAIEQMNEVELREAVLEEVAREWFDECYLHEVPERVQPYIDYEGFAQDCRIAGDLREFQFGGRTWTCTNVH